jgi:HD-GYP domain-containing protein (c-di-GMP phosphodiesterase class II)
MATHAAGPRPEGAPDAGLDELRREVERLRAEFRAVSDLGMRLATEMDPGPLLPLIVSEARRFTRSEAGSLYVREGEELRFAVAQNDALARQGRSVEAPSIRLRIDGSSLAGLAAAEKRTLNIEDARTHPSFSARARDEFAYEVRSMLVVPMVDHRGDVLGVLQLMNALDDAGQPQPYSERAAYLSGVLASHAATAMEIAQLHAELHEVFEALVRYSTSAIDARDACTAGHSSRVGSYARQLAEEVGGFTDAELREIRFAGIFHDIGKIGVRECVLTKSTKLEPAEMAAVEARFAAACEAAAARPGRAPEPDQLLAEVEFLRQANQPTWLEVHELERLQRLRGMTYASWRGEAVALLTEAEHDKLRVRRGNLTDAERAEIERHVTYSYRFLKHIPFQKDLARVPEIAYSHHERMDGSGYPRGLKGDEIPKQGRILAVVDVFDALTAADRPYKKAIEPIRAVEIIEKECERGAWDRDAVAGLRRLVERGKLVPRRLAEAAAPDDGELRLDRDVWS